MGHDEWMGPPSVPQFSRRVSSEPEDGLVWNKFENLYMETDATFRERIKRTLAAYAATEDPPR